MGQTLNGWKKSPMRSTAVRNSSIQFHIDGRQPNLLLPASKVGRAAGVRTLRGLSMLCALLAISACEAGESRTSALPATPSTVDAPTAVKPEESRMWMIVGDRRFAITLSDNAAARAFAAQLPVTLDMSDLNGNEKHAELPQALPAEATRPGTIRNGDLMLYGADTFVVFYLTFNSSYSYTRLGRVDDPDDLAKVLGRGNVRIEFSKD